MSRAGRAISLFILGLFLSFVPLVAHWHLRGRSWDSGSGSGSISTSGPRVHANVDRRADFGTRGGAAGAADPGELGDRAGAPRPRAMGRIITGLWQSTDASRFGAPPGGMGARLDDLEGYVAAGRTSVAVSLDWAGSAHIVGNLRFRSPGRYPDCSHGEDGVGPGDLGTDVRRTASAPGVGDGAGDGPVCLSVVAVVCGGAGGTRAEDYTVAARTSRSRAREQRTKAVAEVNRAVDELLRATRSKSLASVHLHWHDTDDRDGVRAALESLLRREDVHHVGLANAPAQLWKHVLAAGVPVAVNEVPFSLLDTRASSGQLRDLVDGAAVPGDDPAAPGGPNRRIVAHGVLAGGFLTDKYLGVLEPPPLAFVTPSMRRHLGVIRAAGGWERFQGLLSVLRAVADRHGVSIADVAMRYVLERPYVAAIVVGVRLGVSSHAREAREEAVYSFSLSERDYREIRSAAKLPPGRSLVRRFGEPGQEFQHRRIVPDADMHRSSAVSK